MAQVAGRVRDVRPDSPYVRRSADPKGEEHRLIDVRCDAERSAVPVQHRALIAADPDILEPRAVHTGEVLGRPAVGKRPRATVEMRGMRSRPCAASFFASEGGALSRTNLRFSRASFASRSASPPHPEAMARAIRTPSPLARAIDDQRSPSSRLA